MPTPKRAVRPAPLLLILGALTAGALSGCAPTQAVQPAPVVSGQGLSPYATRADAAVVVFRSQTLRAGAVDVLLDGAPILRRVSSTDSYRVVAVPPGLRTFRVLNSLSGTTLEGRTVNLEAGESYALALDVDPTSREYVLLLGQGPDAVYDLVGP